MQPAVTNGLHTMEAVNEYRQTGPFPPHFIFYPSRGTHSPCPVMNAARMVSPGCNV